MEDEGRQIPQGLMKNAASVLSVFLFLPAALWAESEAIAGKWGGLHNIGGNTLIIDNNEAQDLQDVDLCDDAGCIKKRRGYSQFRTLGVSTWGVRGGHYFRNSAAADLLIHANSKSTS